MAPAAKQYICIEGLCGNGLQDEEEECDDGNRIDGDGCSSDCQSVEICGNAIVDRNVGEVCDDGNTGDGDGCCGDCRSCPELAVAPPAEKPEMNGKISASVAPAPAAIKSALEAPPCVETKAGRSNPARVRSAPAPLLVTTVTPAPFQREPALEETDAVGESLAQARRAAEEAQQKLNAESRTRRRLRKDYSFLNEELQRVQALLAEVERINAELHEYIAGQCLRLPSGRSMVMQ
jgi:cysteine-rich repeat protein